MECVCVCVCVCVCIHISTQNHMSSLLDYYVIQLTYKNMYNFMLSSVDGKTEICVLFL